LISATIVFAVMAAVLLFLSGWVIASSKADSARRALEAQTAQRAERDERTNELESNKQLHAMLASVLEREKLTLSLSHLADDPAHRDLSQLLDAIAEAGHFSTVMLSDNAGLPVATSTNIAASSDSIERLVGASSLMLIVADRADTNGEPRPLGFVVHDESNRMACYRIFEVDGARFLLTVTTRARQLVPSSLDPIVGTLEATLARPLEDRVSALPPPVTSEATEK
jgi:CTP:molybdopterin cytidylyltransferase MocA